MTTAVIRSGILALIISFSFAANAQDDLMDVFGPDEEKGPEIVNATFKTTKVVTGHSTENPANGVLLFIISHRFGRLNEGAYELFGLDRATIRFGLEYGVNDRLSVGAGRSSFEKTFDGFLKYKILRQSRGKGAMPVSLVYFSGMALNSLKWDAMGIDPERKNYFSSRLSYVHQLLISRKFSDRLSLQLSPTLVHRNLVPESRDKNDIYAMGAGGRFKLSNRVSFNGEYYYVLPGQIHWDYQNCLSLGLDIETGGHVFQLVVTNSQAMFERGFITDTKGYWDKGDLYFGFNISRVFTLKKPKTFRE